ncbi:4012_t:CDS:2, partial [Racocetra persica]
QGPRSTSLLTQSVTAGFLQFGSDLPNERDPPQQGLGIINHVEEPLKNYPGALITLTNEQAVKFQYLINEVFGNNYIDNAQLLQTLKLVLEKRLFLVKPASEVFSTPFWYKKDLTIEIIDLYIALEVVSEVSNFDTEVALKNLIDGYLEILETWMSKPNELEGPKLENRGD